MDIKRKLQEAIAFHQSDQLQQAEQIYQQVLQISPRNADALNLLGFLAYQVGKCEIAANLITEAIEVDSNQSMFFINLGLVRQNQGELEGSIEAYHKAIEINPNDSDVYNNLGNTLQEKGELEESIEAYHKAIEINPNDSRIHYNLGAAQKKNRASSTTPSKPTIKLLELIQTMPKYIIVLEPHYRNKKS